MGVGGQRSGRFTPGNDPVPIVQEAGWAPGPVWTGAENLAPTRIRSPDRPARSESLYRLRYPGPYFSNLARENVSGSHYSHSTEKFVCAFRNYWYCCFQKETGK
jgi:hypothetical protein